MINETRFKIFAALYRAKLEEAVRNFPGDYHWDPHEIDGVISRMEAAIRRGSFNKDGRAFKATCKALGINHTYKAIYTYLAGT
jgi:hypothetical protein